MTIEETTPASSGTEELARLEKAGDQAARSVKASSHRSGDLDAAEFGTRAKALLTQPGLSDDDRRWVRENHRLIHTAVRELRDVSKELRRQPVVEDEKGRRLPRVVALAFDYLDAAADVFSEDGLVAFLNGYQKHSELGMGEIWAARPALQYAVLQRLTTGPQPAFAQLVTSLRHVGEAQWKELFESVSIVDAVLRGAPDCEYASMDYESRDSYRNAITGVAKHSGLTEKEVAWKALEMAHAAGSGRRACAGYYLVDDAGRERLEDAVGYKRPFSASLRRFLLSYPNGYYLIGVEVATLLIVYTLLSPLDRLTPIVAGFFLLLLPATQAAVDFMNNLTSFLLTPRILPKLDFSKGVPAQYTTMIAVPTLLLSDAQVRDLLLDLEIRYLANTDDQLAFALVTDSPDSDHAFDDRDRLVAVCQAQIEELNARYGSHGRTPFYMFHRHRVFNASEGRWMGWERKRGKLLDLNQLLRGGFDSFPVKVGNLEILPRVKYVITLDSDTQLPRGSAARMIGTMAHPLNRAVVDPNTKMVGEGYGILQPRVGVSIQSSVRSRLAGIYSGQTGFDIYTRAISDVYQDLFGEGSFTGKGIYDVDALNESLGKRFPENALLSHDLIEGAYARAGLVSDIELIDDYPSHFSAYSRRKHRWVRGDWQITRWLLPRVPDYHGNIVPNPTNLISRWKILDNLRRSLFEPATLALFLAGWFYLPGNVWHWTGASIAMWLMPVWASLVFSVLRAPVGRPGMKAWARDFGKAILNGHLMALLGIGFLLHQALLSLDAIARSVLRVFVTRRKLLEWETAAESETATRGKATVDTYMEWTPWIAAALLGALYLIRPASLAPAAPVLLLWFSSRAISDWLNRAPRGTNKTLTDDDVELLDRSADKILAFFDEWSNEANHYLIPDNIRESGAVADRLSPTNVGFLLNVRIAALLMGRDSLETFVLKVRRSLDTLIALPKYKGHLLNWYDTGTLQPVEPLFVSTVDSGNLVACLWTLKQAALEFASEDAAKRGLTDGLRLELQRIAEDSHAVADAMEFEFLFHKRRKVLSVGFDTAAGKLEQAAYDLLASESRIACFVAIAKGDIPQDAWFHLGRRHTLAGGEQVLVSWTGTMFEYLMPALWMRHHLGTILEDSLQRVVRVQQEYGRRKGVPWGISESACSGALNCEYGYAAFGVPELAMKAVGDKQTLVISPYSTFLGLLTDPQAAVANLRVMDGFGWSGSYGFYEAVDYTLAGGDVIRSWMAHHQGMSLLSICNVLLDFPLPRLFHAEPRVLATELLLHERVPSAVTVEAEEVEPAAAA